MMKSRIQTILLVISTTLVLSLFLFTELITTANAVGEASLSITNTETGSKELFVTGSDVFMAYFATDCYALTISHTGSGTNPYPDPPRNPPCPTGQYLPGATINFLPNPDEHWFTGSWTGTDGDTIPTLTMPAADHEVTVHYEPICFELETEVVPTGGGAVDPSPGPSCPAPDPATDYLEGTVVTLTATISDGYRFSFWSGGVTGTITQTVVTMNSDFILTDTITANFDKACHPLFLTHAPPGTGSNPQANPSHSIECNADGWYVFDENITLEDAIPNPGWQVDSWEGTDDNGSTSISNTLTFPRLPASSVSGHIVTVNYIQKPTLEFSAATYTVNEDDGIATISVKRTGSLRDKVTVHVRSSDDTATAGQDYVTISETLTFSENIDERILFVQILDDGISEGTESLKLSLSEQSDGAELGPQAEAELIILDNEGPPTVQFSTTTYEAVESSSTIPIIITLYPPSAGDVYVDFETSAGTAASGVDYYDVVKTIRFRPGQESKQIAITLVDDALDELDETIHLKLFDVLYADLGASEAILTLLDDDDPPSVQFSTGAYFAQEGDPTAPLTVTLSAATSLTVTVDYTVVEIPNGQPYIGNIKFNPGEVSKTIDVPIATYKADDILSALLSDVENASLAPPSSASLTILDKGCLDFSSATYTVNEDAGNASISVKRTGSLQEKVTVLVRSSDDTATAGQDYVTISETLTFSENIDEQTLTILIFDDNISEGTESLKLSLSNQSANADLGPQAEAELTILDDDDPPSVQFSAGVYFAEEGDTTAPLTVTLSAATSLPVTVNYTVTEKPSVKQIVGDIIFNPGEVSQTIDVPIAGYQADDILGVQLSVEDHASLGIPSSAELIIHSECYFLTLNHTGHGAPPVATNMSQAIGCRAGHYMENDRIEVRAQPDPGWFINGWQGTQNDDAVVPENEVIMPDSDHSVTAYYITSSFLPYVSKDYVDYFDGPEEVEPNNKLNTSQANGLIRSGQTYIGGFPTASDLYDVFFFTLATKGNVEIDLKDIPFGRDYNLYLYSSDGVLESYSGSVDNEDEHISNGNLDQGVYFVAIHNSAGEPSSAHYSLIVDFE